MTHVRSAVARAATVRGDATAVRSRTRALTYRALDELASRVTGFLTARQVGEGSRVIVHMARDVDLFPVLLGILGAGAAFVPVDAATPVERLRRIVQDCDPALVVVDEERRPLHFRGTVTLSEILAHDLQSPAMRDADRAAYVLYTSGTTGDPKGVVVGSDGMHRYLEWARREYRMDAGTGAPLFTSIAFDATLTTLFGPLLAGGTVTVIEEQNPVLELADILRHTPDFSFVKATPHHVRLLAELLDGQRLHDTMGCLVVGGDELDTATVLRWINICPVPVVNEYGPTETVVGCSIFTVRPDEVGTLGPTVPIGRAAAGARLHVLDQDGDPVPFGEVGELFIGGPCASNYYLGKPAGTAAKFVPDPFDGEGTRMYRTGDLAAVRPDGVLEFHGRSDRQVKVRGHRVELGEIEAVIRSVPGVVDVAAFTTPGPNVSTVAVFTGDTTPQMIRDHLVPRVPTWIVPGRIVRAAVLPTTTNAKADLAGMMALISTETSAAHDDTSTEPLTATLAAEFGAVLPDAVISPDSDFYAAGGDSMSAIRLIARLRKLGLDAVPADVTAHPTPAALAARLAARGALSRHQHTTDVDLAVDFTPAQRDFLSLDLPDPAHWNQVKVLAAPLGLDVERARAAVAAVAARHDVLRYRFRDGRQIHVGGAPAVDFQETTAHDFAGLEAVIRRANTGLDLSAGPLARIVVARGPDRPDHLILVAHHLVVDEVSWHVFLDDLAQAYRNETTIGAAGPARGFAQWRTQLARFAEQPEVVARRPYWERILATRTGRVPGAAEDSDDYSAEHYRRDGVDAATTAKLRSAAAEAEVGIHEILLGAVAATLSAEFDIEPPRIDVETHGRVDVGHGLDAIDVMGWCTAVFPVVLSGPSTVDFVRSAHDALAGLPWHGTEFGLLRLSETAPSRTAHVLFNYLGERDRVLDQDLGWILHDPPPGVQSPPAGRRPYLLEFQSRLVDGALDWEWRAGAHHSAGRIQALSDRLRRRLDTLAVELASDPTIRFADSGLSAVELTEVMALYSGAEQETRP